MSIQPDLRDDGPSGSRLPRDFVWGVGYANRFGLVSVDFATQRRIPKASAHRYARTIHAEAMEAVK